MRITNLTTIGILLALAGNGCASSHHHDSWDQNGTAESEAQMNQKIVIVNGDENSGPPPTRNDMQPPQPKSSSNWVAGHWLHDPQLNAWVWVPGRWR